LALLFDEPRHDRHASAFRKFEGITNEIHQYLPEPIGIGDDRLRNSAFPVIVERQASFLCRDAQE
jgi:hypothetical protein